MLRFLVFSFVILILSCRTQAPPALVVSCGSVGKELELCQAGVALWSKQSGQSAQVVTAPSGSGERLGLYQLFLAAHAPDIDVFAIDTTWPGIIGDFFLDLGPLVTRGEVSSFFSAFIENNTVRGRLTALPWFIDAGLLYYRRDLLELYREPVPETWLELTRVAERIQTQERQKGNDRFWGFVFQGRAYEGLTCNALEWIASWGGGTFVDPSGEVTIDGPLARRALDLAAQWVGRISPPGVLNYMEEETRGVFQSGNAVFMRNWPYAWTLSQAADSPVRGKVGLTVLPRGEGPLSRHATTLGGWSLSVSKFSKRPEQAVALIKFLVSPEEQKRRALSGGLNPTLPALYSDPEIVRMNPMMGRLVQVFRQAVLRPSRATGSRYNRVSSEIWDSVHDCLAGKSPVPSGILELKKSLLLLKRGGKW